MGNTTTIKKYVCGFLFSPDGKKVVLVRKNKPEWQKGLLNGVGGKVEEFDFGPLAAMQREFEEETTVYIEDWMLFHTIRGDGWEVDFFRAFEQDIYDVSTPEDGEQIDIYSSLGCPGCIPNLYWLIPMALDPHHQYGTSTAKN